MDLVVDRSVVSAAKAALIGGVCLATMALVPNVAAAKGKGEESLEEAGFFDPRKRQPPATHRFRLGLSVYYVRLSAAVDPATGESQRFHYAPLGLSAAYQAQFARWMMVRPELVLGANVANTMEAMPLLIHPQLHLGYQGSVMGVAFGYGWFSPPIQNKDAISDVRDGLGQPVITNNHHLGGEVSVTTRVDRGALSFQFRVHGVKSRTQHFELDNKRWRPMIMVNLGWYFGNGDKQRKRAASRKLDRRRRRR
ncbi:MAG: hypothetical protein JKY37_12635 [Nannocystaceae bacterium]|nr:hypothetical protein [Nannocystaceae bacterium]